MSRERERSALVALLRRRGLRDSGSLQLIEQAGGAEAALTQQFGAMPAQPSLFPADAAPPATTSQTDSRSGGDPAPPTDAERLIARAQQDTERWGATGIQVITVLDEDYPVNLRAVHDAPPVIFVAGRLCATDEASIAVIGSRRASGDGLRRTAELSRGLVEAGLLVVSGLAAGVDTAAHHAALAMGGRTVAVIGTGLEHAYPPQNAGLQREIASRCAVVSQFWPEAPPTRASFPLRNGLMSGLTRGTLIVEASARSGARIQARLALAQRRPVFLLRSLLEQSWAQELAARPDVHAVDSADQIVSLLARRSVAPPAVNRPTDATGQPCRRSTN